MRSSKRNGSAVYVSVPSEEKSPASPVFPSIYPSNFPLKFCIFSIVFVFFYCLIYGPLLANWPGDPQHRPNLTWVLHQRDTFMQILQPHNLTALITPSDSRCDPQRLVTVVVCSALEHDKARMAIRETWGTEMPNHSRLFFLVGRKTTNDSKLQDKIEAESTEFDDVIQEDFEDTYNNLTIKSAFLLKWANYSGCGASSKFILKTDDDMYINIANLVSVLKAKGKPRQLLGALIVKAVPHRDYRSKWFVPTYVYADSIYPDYLSGTGYVISTDVIADLLRMTETTPFFHLEDIYITGLLARRLGLRRVNHEGFKFFKRKSNVCLFRRLISAHMMSPSELRKMWPQVIDRTRMKCR